MEDRKEKIEPWLSVPQFGDWDQKGQVPDYSLDFSKIREMRKQNKRDVSRASIGNEEEFISASSSNTNMNTAHSTHHHYNQEDHSPTVKLIVGDVIGNLGDKEKHFELLQLLCKSMRFGGASFPTYSCFTFLYYFKFNLLLQSNGFVQPVAVNDIM